MKTIKDLAVVVGMYEKDGETKKRYKNVGVMIEDPEKGSYILLDTTFNPAGVPNPSNSDKTLISIFTPRDHPGNAQPNKPQPKDDTPF